MSKFDKILMRIVFGALIVLTFMAATEYTVQFWGKNRQNEIRWGKTFLTRSDGTADSIRLAYYVTFMDSTDTLYSEFIPVDAGVTGVLNTTMSYDSVATTDDISSDSIYYDMRLYYDIDIHPRTPWGPWRNLDNNATTETLYELSIIQQDSTWWRPCDGIQFRTYKVDTSDCRATDRGDTLTPNLGVYLE